MICEEMMILTMSILSQKEALNTVHLEKVTVIKSGIAQKKVNQSTTIVARLINGVLRSIVAFQSIAVAVSRNTMRVAHRIKRVRRNTAVANIN